LAFSNSIQESYSLPGAIFFKDNEVIFSDGNVAPGETVSQLIVSN